MNSMITFTAILATVCHLSMAQVPYPYSYAPAFSYSTHGTPASTAKAYPIYPAHLVPATRAYSTGLVGNAPLHYSSALPLSYPRLFQGYSTPQVFSGFPYSASVSALPAGPAVQVSPIESPVAVAGEAISPIAPEVQASPLSYAQETFSIRRIFPQFVTDLRSGNTAVSFARPDQVNFAAGAQDPALGGDEFVVVGSPLNLRSFPQSPIIPAGIVQGNQPQLRGAIAV